MKKTMIKSFIFACLLTAILAGGCAPILNIAIKGGTAVKPDYQPKKVLVSYRAEGNVPENTKYYLVETETGEAIFEKVENKTSALFTTHWRDDLGDHFSSWVVAGPGYEFIVPLDRTKQASRYVYPKNQYNVGGKRGLGAVAPIKAFQPATILTPE